MSVELVLLSTDHCTLCEQALDLLLSMPELGGHSVRVVDVACDDRLLAEFGDQIPVLEVRNVRDSEPKRLHWPFDAARILDFMS